MEFPFRMMKVIYNNVHVRQSDLTSLIRNNPPEYYTQRARSCDWHLAHALTPYTSRQLSDQCRLGIFRRKVHHRGEAEPKLLVKVRQHTPQAVTHCIKAGLRGCTAEVGFEAVVGSYCGKHCRSTTVLAGKQTDKKAFS